MHMRELKIKLSLMGGDCKYTMVGVIYNNEKLNRGTLVHFNPSQEKPKHFFSIPFVLTHIDYVLFKLVSL